MRWIPFIILGAVACETADQKITVYSEPPSVAIQFPTNGTTVDQGVEILLKGLIQDDKFASSLDVMVGQWTANGQPVCPDALVDAAGIIECTHVFESIGNVQLELSATNPDGEQAKAEVNIEVASNEAPIGEIVSPPDIDAPEGVADGFYYKDVPIRFEAKLTDAEDDPTDLQAAWESDLDGDLGIGSAVDSAGTNEGFATLTEGEHKITLTATDSTGRFTTESISLTVGDDNIVPTCSILTPLENDVIIQNDQSTFTGQGDDPDIPNELLSVIWSSNIDGELGIQNADPAGEFAISVTGMTVGEHTITLTVEDETGATCTDSVAIIVGSAPSITIITPQNNEVANEQTQVNFEAQVSDTEDTPSEIEMRWSSNLDGIFTVNNANSDGSAYALAFDMTIGNHIITLEATDSDGFTASTSINLKINDLPTAPVIDISPAPPNSAQDVSVLITQDAVDVENDPIVYSYTWSKNGNLTNETGPSVSKSATLRGETWSVLVTPNDGYGDGESVTAETVIINAPPEIQGLEITPNSPLETDLLSCNVLQDYDEDGDPISYSYAWQVDGALINPTSQTLDGAHFDHGQNVVCIVTPNDGTDDGAPFSSPSVLILNTPPVLVETFLTPTTAYEGSTLQCMPGSSSDADGDPITFHFNWSVNGVPVNLNAPELTGAFFNKGDSVFCQATPNDGFVDGATVDSNSITIQNTAPEIDQAFLAPTPAYEDSTLICTAGIGTDEDGDSVAFLYNWEKNGSLIGISSSTLSGTHFNKNDSMRCQVTPTDGFDNGTEVYSSAIVISNTSPSANTVDIVPSNAFTEDTLSADVDGWNDLDGDAEDYIYDWQVNGITVTSDVALDPSFTAKGDSIKVTVTPFDGTDTGQAITSSSILIQNTPPGAPTIDILPNNAEPVDDLLCEIVVDSYDPDNDPITYTYEWLNNGQVVSGITIDTINSSLTSNGETWTCTVTPNDGNADGSAAADSQTVLDVTAPDTPVLDAIDPYRNDGFVSISGTTEPGAAVILHQNCNSGLSTQTTIAGSTGVFNLIVSVIQGDVCDFYAYAEDIYNNQSGQSNILTTEYCSTGDDHEDLAGTGDTCSGAVDIWPTLLDDGNSTIVITGNIINTTDQDWYYFTTTQSNITSGINTYNFSASLTAGQGSYDIFVYRGSCSSSDLQCANSTDEYSFFAEDQNETSNSDPPSDSRFCENGSLYNICDDLSQVYFVQVVRQNSTINCDNYVLEVSNGY